MRVLAGDLGGTKTLLAIFDVDQTGRHELRKQRYVSLDYPGLTEMVADFLPDCSDVQAACFGVAGPVLDEIIPLPNLPWSISRRRLAAHFGDTPFDVINDFAAVGHGLTWLDADDLLTLQTGAPVIDGPRAVIGAGTGLGQAFLLKSGECYDIFPSEGGHCTFAPQTALETDLAVFLRDKYDGHVSWERLVSGQGITNIYHFLLSHHGRSDRLLNDSDDHAATVSTAGLGGHDDTATESMQLFLKLYGVEAGNLALKFLATGGVYVAGGIATKIATSFANSPFLDGFRAKGRLASFVSSIPLHIVTNPEVGLLGAGAYATRLLK